MMVIFLVDGFNLYHSICDAIADGKAKGQSLKWLNIKALCESYLSAISPEASLAQVHYFSAIMKHRIKDDPTIEIRHNLFMRCLRDTGIENHLGHFKEREFYCPNCKGTRQRHDEKETDTSIASHVFKFLKTDSADCIILVSGDTDFYPVLQIAKELYPEKKFGVLFPYARRNDKLATVVDYDFKIKPEKYAMHQFSNPHVCTTGTKIKKPATW